MGAADGVAAAVEEAFLILTEAVKVLIGWGGEGGANLEEGGVLRAAVVEDIGVAILVIGHGHLPAVEVQEIFAIGGADREADAGGAAVEEASDVGLGSGGFVRATWRGDGGGEAG